MAILDFREERFYLFFIYKIPRFPTNGPFGSEVEVQHGFKIGFPSETILAVLDLQITMIFLPSFESIGLAVQEK